MFCKTWANTAIKTMSYFRLAISEWIFYRNFKVWPPFSAQLDQYWLSRIGSHLARLQLTSQMDLAMKLWLTIFQVTTLLLVFQKGFEMVALMQYCNEFNNKFLFLRIIAGIRLEGAISM